MPSLSCRRRPCPLEASTSLVLIGTVWAESIVDPSAALRGLHGLAMANEHLNGLVWLLQPGHLVIAATDVQGFGLKEGLSLGALLLCHV